MRENSGCYFNVCCEEKNRKTCSISRINILNADKFDFDFDFSWESWPPSSDMVRRVGTAQKSAE